MQPGRFLQAYSSDQLLCATLYNRENREVRKVAHVFDRALHEVRDGMRDRFAFPTGTLRAHSRSRMTYQCVQARAQQRERSVMKSSCSTPIHPARVGLNLNRALNPSSDILFPFQKELAPFREAPYNENSPSLRNVKKTLRRDGESHGDPRGATLFLELTG